MTLSAHFLAKKIPITKLFSFPIQKSLYSAAYPLIILTFPLNLLSCMQQMLTDLPSIIWPFSKSPHIYIAKSEIYKLNF